jgi:tRNA-dihydrouridine synthase B
MVRRARGKAKISPFVIQLAGREAKWMAEGARLAQDLGADIIDINMGCPARQVTGGLSGSALMRDPDHAVSLIEATVAVAKVPVTVKMRLGWDHSTMNAPLLARRAENAGASMITVHGRTRCMFYTGRADWQAIRAVREAISIPLVANGDGETAADALAMMAASGANAVMFGRSCYGRPWWPGDVAEQLAPGTGRAAPSLLEQRDIMLWHQEETLILYGADLGNRTFRKHLGWALSRLELAGHLDAETHAKFRGRLLGNRNNADVTSGIREAYQQAADLDAGALAA